MGLSEVGQHQDFIFVVENGGGLLLSRGVVAPVVQPFVIMALTEAFL